MRDGRYQRELERRMKMTENRYKTVRATLTRVGEDHLQVLMADAGPSFDYCRYQTFDRERVFDNHGRGILLAWAAVDVEYFHPPNAAQQRAEAQMQAQD